MHSNDQIPHDSPSTPSSPIKIEDLPVEAGKEADVKGGPAYMKLGDIKGEVISSPTTSAYKINIQLDSNTFGL